MSDTFEKRKQSTADGRRRAILITGAASGMGREAALLFSKQGWFVVAFDINLEDFGGNAELQERVRPGLKSLEKELGGSANVYIRKVDVANKADFDAAVADLEKKLPGLTGAKSAACSVDVCFANAGIARFGLFATSPFEYHEAVMNINFKGVINTIYDSLNLMKENRGALVFSTSSSSAMYGIPGLAIYSATKHAVKGLTEALSIELDSLYGIRAADTLPGIIRTNLIPEAWVDGAVKDGPWRLIEAKEIADALWASWLDDPSAVDGKGMSTVGRLHWYIPEELQEDTDALVNVRGGAEKVRETVRARFQSPEDAIGQLDKKSLIDRVLPTRLLTLCRFPTTNARDTESQSFLKTWNDTEGRRYSEKDVSDVAIANIDASRLVESTGCCGGNPPTWSWTVTRLYDALFLRCSLLGESFFDFEIGAGGSLGKILDQTRGGLDLVAPSLHPDYYNDRMGCMLALWSNELRVDAPARNPWNQNQGGWPELLAPIISVNSGEGYVDVYSLIVDQFNSALQTRVKTRIACRTRYSMMEDGVLIMTRTMHFGATTVDGQPKALTSMYLENWCTTSLEAFTTVSMSIDPQGNLSSSTPLPKVPYYPHTPASKTKGYAILSNSTNDAALAYIANTGSNQEFNTMPFDSGTAICFAATFPQIKEGEKIAASAIIAKGSVENEMLEKLQKMLNGKSGEGVRTAGLAPLLNGA